MANLIPLRLLRAYSQVDVFTSGAFAGNPLPVVHDAQGLSDAQMSALARWTNLTETVFLVPPTDPSKADYRLRIFTSVGELPFAGHPTIGACHAWLESGGSPATAGEVVQECGIGLVRIRLRDGRLAFEAPQARRTSVDDATLKKILAALGLASDRLLASQCLDNGPRWVGLMLDSASTVLALRPDFNVLSDLPSVGVIGRSPSDSEADFEVRAFAPGIGVNEDPVTGSLNASLAQWLIGTGAAPLRYAVSQGAQVGRAGRIFIEQIDGSTWVGGDSITCIRGTLTIGSNHGERSGPESVPPISSA